MLRGASDGPADRPCPSSWSSRTGPQAIAAAVALAGAGDAVVVAGKGHERARRSPGVVHPFDDREVLRAVARVGERWRRDDRRRRWPRSPTRSAGGCTPATRRRSSRSVVLDSREVEPGGLFVAVKGERVDGHDFASRRSAAGAVGGPRPARAAGALRRGRRSLAALGRPAPDGPRPAAGRARSSAVTGSSGKTSTKDLHRAVLVAAGPTVAPAGSYNNEIGLPLTVLRADEDTRVLVAEMGARGVGHIADLTRIAPPAIGVVLNVGTAHLGEFGSVDAIAQAKGELVEALPPPRTAASRC